MAYNGGRLPMEAASKIAHMELINDAAVQQLLQSFRTDTASPLPRGLLEAETADLGHPSPIRTVITIDGGLTVVPNPQQRTKSIAFVQVGAMIIDLQDLQAIENDPMMDPRTVGKFLQNIDRFPAVVPLSGVRLPNTTLRETNRQLLNSALSANQTNLYPTLHYLLQRDWLPPNHPDRQQDRRMTCVRCGNHFDLPNGYMFSCPSCRHDHYLSDYLNLGGGMPEDWSKPEYAMMVMAFIELLALLKLPVRLAQIGQLPKLRNLLFIKDGPLVFRAQGNRLMDSIRAFIMWINDAGHPFHLAGVEKTGDFVTFLDAYKHTLPTPGSYFIPSQSFANDQIFGRTPDPTSRNRVSYGSRIGVRLSKEHIVALHIPTKFMSEQEPKAPTFDDLINAANILATLSKLTSSSHDNALLPVTLANRAVSLSTHPSSRILDDYVNEMIGSAP